MKSFIALSSMIIIAASTALAEGEVPKRKPGLWEIKVQSTEAPAQAMKQCIDEATDASMQELGSKFGQNCTRSTTRKEGSAYISESECSVGNTIVVSRSVSTGDFTSKYESEVTAKFTPAFMGKNESKSKILAERVGDCEGGLKPGDMVLPNGLKMNINSFPGMPAKAN